MRIRSLASGWMVAFALPLAACFGGPHPHPPGDGIVSRPSSPVPSTASNPTPGAMPPSQSPTAGGGAPSLPRPQTPTSGAAGSGATGMAPNPAMPAAGGGAQAPITPPSGAPGGNAGTGAAAAGSSSTPPSQGAGGAGGSAPGTPTGEACDGPTGALSASDAAPENLLFVLDRSLEMAGDFQGSPRWQMAALALSHALGARAEQVTIGALLYPSGSSAACSGPDWLCALQQSAMCTVSEMSAADQVAFQPGAAALSTLRGDRGLYAPVTAAAGVPLAETLQRADAALANRGLSGRTTVVILASGMPTCGWNAEQANATLARWKSERGVQTHVIALPGSAVGTAQALAGLAAAGGTGRVHAPNAAGALEATLQSIVVDSLSSCTLELDSPAPDPGLVRVLVTEDGAERLLPRVSAMGEPLWTISDDGRVVTLVGSACEAARGGTYEAVRVVLGCARQ